jgi:hypothetical protein
MTRFVLDEHVSRAYVTQLRRHDAALYIERVGDGDAPAKGTADADLLVYCEEQDLLLVTNTGRRCLSIWQTIWGQAGTCPAYS